MAFLVVGVIALAIAGAIGRLAGWPLAATVLLAGLIAAAFVLVVLIINNGDFPAWREIAAERAIRQRAIKEHSKLLQLQERHRHIETLQQIAVDKITAETQLQHQRRLAAEEDANAKLISDTHKKRKRQERHPTYVPAVPSPAREAAYEYAISLYNSSGINPDMVHPSRQLKSSVPWNTAWKNEEYCEEAKRLLTDGVQPFLVQEQLPNNKSYFVSYHYPTIGHVKRKLFT